MSEPARLPAQRPPEQPPSILRLISEAMTQPGFDVAIMREMLAMYREQQAKEALRAYVADMTLAQGEMRAVLRDAENTQTHSRYARLETIDDAIRPIYTKYGFALSFSHADAKTAGNVRVSCACMHRDGHVEHFDSPEAPPDMYGARGVVNKTPLHGMGSTISYQRRYLTTMIFNVVLITEDDDGNAGGGTIRNIASGMGENIRREQPAGGVDRQHEQPNKADRWLTKFMLQASLLKDSDEADRLIAGTESQYMKDLLTKHADPRLQRYNEIVTDVMLKWFAPPGADDPSDDPDNIVPKDGSDSV